MSTYLVTGGLGFIGSHFIKSLVQKYRDAQIVNIDKVTYCSNFSNLIQIENNPNYHFFQADICDAFAMRSIIMQFKPDYIINFAAETHVDNSIQNAENFIKSNFVGVYTLLNIVKDLIKDKDLELKRFVQISTDEVYGSVIKPSKEDTKFDPSSPYSSSKAGGDLLALSYYKTFDLPVVVTRSSNNYGPNQFPEKVIPVFITKLMKNEKVPLYGKGLNSRDWLYVEDNCEAIDLVTHYGKNGEAYNIASNYVINNLELTKMILKGMKKDNSFIDYVADRLGHDWKYIMSTKKIREQLGWKPKIKFKDGLKKTIEWYKENTTL